MLLPSVAAYVFAAAIADGSNDAGGTLGDGAAEPPADAEATGAVELAGVEAPGAVVDVPLPQAAKTMAAVATRAPARQIPNLDWFVTLGLLSS